MRPLKKIATLLASLLIATPAYAEDWEAVTPDISVKSIPESSILTPDRKHIAYFSFWIRTNTPHHLQLVQINCNSKPYQWRTVTTLNYETTAWSPTPPLLPAKYAKGLAEGVCETPLGQT
jgi:hypothetical protein